MAYLGDEVSDDESMPSICEMC